MPNGDLVNFPDDMPMEEIKALIEHKFPNEVAQARQGAQGGQAQPMQAAPAPSTQAQPEAPQVPAQREGLFPQFASGMTEGAANFLSLPNTVEMGLRSIGPAIGNAMGGDFAYPESSMLPDAGASLRSFADNTGAMTEPTNDMGGRMVRRIGQEVGGNIVPMASTAGSLGRKAAELGLTLASGSGAAVANQLAPDNPLADMAGQAAGFGLGAGALELGRKLITPNPMTSERAAIVKALKNEGIDLTAGQATGNKNLQYMESELGGDAAQNFMETQGDQFTNAALDRIGVTAPRATPEVLDRAYRNIGSEFDRLAASSSVPVDQAFVGDLNNTVASYQNLLESNAAPAVQNYIDEIFDHAAKSPAGQPMLSGDQYQSLRSRIGADMRRTSSPALQDALGDIQSALDDAVERYLSVASPDDIPAWKEVRNQYRNFLVIEKAAAGAGEKTAQGILSPAQIRNAIVQQSKRGYVRGMGDFADLARNATATMTPLPNSGTAARLGAKGVVTSIPTIAGTLLGGAAGAGNPLAAIAGGAAGAVVPGQIGKAMISPMGRSYLANQLIKPGPGYSGNINSLLARALTAQGRNDQ
jgi:hypothetical protein